MSQDITIENGEVIMNFGPVESVNVGQAGGVMVHTTRGTVITLPLWVIEGIDQLSRCSVCRRIASVVYSACPDCRHWKQTQALHHPDR